jgi:hypothetical protein
MSLCQFSPARRNPDRPSVLGDVRDHDDLRTSGHAPALAEPVELDLAEASGESHLLRWRDPLIPEEHDSVSGVGLFDCGERRVVERLSQVDAPDLSTQRRTRGNDLDGHDGTLSFPAAAAGPTLLPALPGCELGEPRWQGKSNRLVEIVSAPAAGRTSAARSGRWAGCRRRGCSRTVSSTDSGRDRRARRNPGAAGPASCSARAGFGSTAAAARTRSRRACSASWRPPFDTFVPLSARPGSPCPRAPSRGAAA